MEERKSFDERYREAVALAEIYYDDGAPASAARCLREAADTLEALAEARMAIIHEAMK